MTEQRHWCVEPIAHPLSGTILIPGDKSISHRAMMLAAIAEGTSEIDGFLEGADTRATAAIMSKLGVRIETPSDYRRIVHGVGLHGLKAPTEPLDCGNAGTGMRLLSGLLAGQAFNSTLIGDASLSKRPMLRVTQPLAQMGAHIETASGGVPPLHVLGGQQLHGIEITTAVASAQVKSAILLAGLYAQGTTIVREPHPTRDYTESMMKAFGVSIDYQPGYARLHAEQTLHAQRVQVPADFSSAAFFIVAASIVPGSEIVLPAVGINPRRIGLLSVLQLMGADIALLNQRESGGELIADIQVRHAPLQAIDVPPHVVPDMIDEFPILFVAAACARGTTRIRGAEELRVKESDRIATMATGLRALGVEVKEVADGADIQGSNSITGGVIDSHDDHRIAMSFAVLALRADAQIEIRDVDNVATSFPNFEDNAHALGFALHAFRSERNR